MLTYATKEQAIWAARENFRAKYPGATENERDNRLLAYARIWDERNPAIAGGGTYPTARDALAIAVAFAVACTSYPPEEAPC